MNQLDGGQGARQMRHFRLTAPYECGLGAIFVFLSPAAQAQVMLPPVNLGDTSFLDSVAGPGLMVEETISYSSATNFRDGDGRRVPTPQDITIASSLTHVAWLSRTKLFGAYWGAEVIVPVARVELNVDAGTRGAATATGDLFVSPVILQWPEQRLFGRPFWQRLNLNLTLPTGRYDGGRLVNIGDNTVRFNPHYAFTWMASDKWEVSGRVHYLWVSKNNNPPEALSVDRIQAGQALHANLSVSHVIADGLRLGVASYFLQQIADDKIDGAKVDNSRERVFGIGPGALWRRQNLTIAANGYFETAVRNRPKQTRAVLRFAYVF